MTEPDSVPLQRARKGSRIYSFCCCLWNSGYSFGYSIRWCVRMKILRKPKPFESSAQVWKISQIKPASTVRKQVLCYTHGFVSLSFKEIWGFSSYRELNSHHIPSMWNQNYFLWKGVWEVKNVGIFVKKHYILYIKSSKIEQYIKSSSWSKWIVKIKTRCSFPW